MQSEHHSLNINIVVVRHASQPSFTDQSSDDFIETSSQAGEKVVSQAQREKLEREKKKAHMAAERERLLGEKKVEAIVGKFLLFILLLFIY